MQKSRTLIGVGLLIAVMVGSILMLVQSLPSFGLMYQGRLLAIAIFIAWSMVVALICLVAKLKFGGISQLITEIALLSVCLFAPVAYGVTLLNHLGKTEKQEVSFTFISERAFFSTPFGMLKTDKAKPTKYQLSLLDEQGEQFMLTYKNGPLFPRTQPGELIAFPMQRGLFGTWQASLE